MVGYEANNRDDAFVSPPVRHPDFFAAGNGVDDEDRNRREEEDVLASSASVPSFVSIYSLLSVCLFLIQMQLIFVTGFKHQRLSAEHGLQLLLQVGRQ